MWNMLSHSEETGFVVLCYVKSTSFLDESLTQYNSLTANLCHLRMLIAFKSVR